MPLDIPMLRGRLWSSDVRMLACRDLPDPRQGDSCHKQQFAVADRSLWLCPKRVALFQSAREGVSLAGVRCDQPALL